MTLSWQLMVASWPGKDRLRLERRGWEAPGTEYFGRLAVERPMAAKWSPPDPSRSGFMPEVSKVPTPCPREKVRQDWREKDETALRVGIVLFVSSSRLLVPLVTAQVIGLERRRRIDDTTAPSGVFTESTMRGRAGSPWWIQTVQPADRSARATATETGDQEARARHET